MYKVKTTLTSLLSGIVFLIRGDADVSRVVQLREISHLYQT